MIIRHTLSVGQIGARLFGLSLSLVAGVDLLMIVSLTPHTEKAMAELSETPPQPTQPD